MSQNVSVSPEGVEYQLPKKEDYPEEFEKIKKLADAARSEGKEIVVVMGVGFVGAVMAAIVADTENEKGNSTKLVIGCQRPSTRSFWKIPLLNRGESPVKAEDPEVDKMISRCVNDKKTLTLYLDKIKNASNFGGWKISPITLYQIDSYYDDISYGWWGDYLPNFFFAKRLFQIQIWQIF